MLIVISKIFALLSYPLTLALALVFAGLILLHRKKNRAAVALILGAVIVLWLFSSLPLAYWLVRSLERQYSPVTSFPQTSALVLLTGGEVAKAPPRLYDEVSDAGDRILYAGRLLARHAAPRCIITGGTIDFLRSTEGSQAQAAFHLLADCRGVDTSLVLLENRARNTYENGVYTKKLLDSLNLPASVILVTSAMHMPRSVAIFKKLGFTVYPAPVDYRADAPCPFKPIYFFPTSGGLDDASCALHEWYGIAAYRLLGWL
jgi:uncharacterized SAM-binding protein YcdF (DUF218 family)